MNEAMEVTAVLVNHNGARTILDAIEAVRQQEYRIRQIIVVDNGSTDGSPEKIRELFPDVRLIEVEQNPGPAYARNLGLSTAETELLLWLDNDIYLAPDSLRKMVTALWESQAAVVCPRIVFFPGKDLIQCDGAGIHFCGVLSLHHANRPISLKPGRTFPNAAGSACLLVRRAVLLEIGGFDESFFFYFEDLELSYRLRSGGGIICCESDAIVYHDRGAGSLGLAFRGEGPYPARRVYYLLFHRWMVVLIYYRLRSMLLLSPALMFYEIASFAECLRRGWLRHWLRALVSVLRKIPMLLARRSKSQKMRRINDRSLLSGGPLPFSPGFIKTGFESELAGILNRMLNGYWELVRQWL